MFWRGYQCQKGLDSSLWLRYFSPSSSGERESALVDSEAWLGRGIVDNPFTGLFDTRKQRGLRTLKGWWSISVFNPHFMKILSAFCFFFNLSSHQINKRKCNTATCVTQRLADFLVRSSNTIGTVYTPTNVGSSTYGKRDLPQPPSCARSGSSPRFRDVTTHVV